MRKIVRSSRFKRDYKKATISAGDIQTLKNVIGTIARREKLSKKFCDHPLKGEWRGYRELHLKTNWLLIYKVTKNELRLARLGSHAQLFG